MAAARGRGPVLLPQARKRTLSLPLTGDARVHCVQLFYIRLARNKSCVMTDMTRDGTFLIESGELRHPVKDLRFTQSYVDALNGVEGVGDEVELVLNGVGFTG